MDTISETVRVYNKIFKNIFIYLTCNNLNFLRRRREESSEMLVLKEWEKKNDSPINTSYLEM